MTIYGDILLRSELKPCGVMQKLAGDPEFFLQVFADRFHASRFCGVVSGKNEYAVSFGSFMEMVIGSFTGDVTVESFIYRLPDYVSSASGD